MANTIQGEAAKVSRLPDMSVASRPAPTVVANDPRPDLDHVSLAISHEGTPLQTATRARGVPDAEVKYRAALRDFLSKGTDFSGAQRALQASGASTQDVARIQAEEASSFFRMSRDEFFHIAGEGKRLSTAFGARPTSTQSARIADLKTQARNAFAGANRADEMLGGLDQQRGQDLEQMESELLSMGFPKDEVQISSRQGKAS